MIENNRRRKISIAVLIIAGEAIFFLPFVIPRIFRATILKVFEINNLALGGYFSIYGAIAMASYLTGGPLADRFPAKNLMAIALWLTAVGGIAIGVWPYESLLPGIYGYWGFTTIFLFWAALIRSTREWGGITQQGKAFGFLEGGRGLVAALIGLLSVYIFSHIVDGKEVVSTTRNQSFQMILFVCSALVATIGGVVWWAIPKKVLASDDHFFEFSKALALFKNPAIWLQAGVIACAYVGYKVTDDYSLYAHEVLEFSEVNAAKLGGGVLWIRAFFAVVAGFVMDRWGGYRVIITAFVLIIAGSSILALGILDKSWILSLLNLSTVLIGVYGLRGVYFAIMNETKIPVTLTGTAVGIMSIIGYTPDVFMSPLMGYLLDSSPGSQGHQYVFLIMTIFGVVGLLCVWILKRIKQTKK